ncbi:lysophospholipid acyltransferase family protein [Marinobacter oulmenensis]|uniref:1-acyl-sn-glycerol-3-phosphate acyltransferase n=1 Tax=Marinobacter oulmenensis TaxID=643747 RepID=A0A840UGP4_9GAMM|nr:lysophospholipid acyltransferase family protein [Marinobacter oulmenensis]MBB5321535.1 1-acyl-sn-glycerol-3-phosphate acyltransferase [Marinobacter oulmenensis]
MNALRALTELARAAARLALFLAGLLVTCMLAVALRLVDLFRSQPVERDIWACRSFRLVGRAMGWQITVHGQLSDGGNALFIANHISWIDIPALGSIQPLRFLSKSEVARWPVIGWLARQGGTLFIQRGARQARAVRENIIHRLEQGESIVIFPEGTTSSGIAVLPMHGLLMSTAGAAGVPIQPVTIGYRRDLRSDALAPFIGDDTFQGHLWRLLKKAPTRIEIVYHEPVLAEPGQTAAELTQQVQQVISRGLADIHAGRYDPPVKPRIRTADGPGLSHLPSHPGVRQSQGRNTG